MAKFQDKKRILEAAREKQKVTYTGAPVRLATDFSMETLHPEDNYKKYSKYWEPETCNQGYFIQQGSQLKWKAK